MRSKNRGPFTDEETVAFLAMMAEARLSPGSSMPPTPSMLRAYNEQHDNQAI